MLISGAIASEKATGSASGMGLAPSVLPGCLLAVLERSGREFTHLTWAEAQLELGKQTGAGVTGPLHLASPPGQEPAHCQVPLSLSMTHGPSCAKSSDLFAQLGTGLPLLSATANVPTGSPQAEPQGRLQQQMTEKTVRKP